MQTTKFSKIGRVCQFAICCAVCACLELAFLPNVSAQCNLSALLQTLNNPAPAAGDAFGFSVAISGNLAVVGADWDDPGGVLDAGTAYVFNATTGVLQATLNNPSPTAGDYFGYSVAISGNLAVVGASGDDPGGGSNAGTAYVFNATTGALQATLNNPASIGNILSYPPKCSKSNEITLA